MSIKVLVRTREEAGVTYGRVVKATEMMQWQDHAHAHVERVVRDLLMRNVPAPLVAGFGYALPGGMNFSVAEGHAVDAQGRSFDTLPAGQASAVIIPPAHAALPRIDLVYATLSADQDAENVFMPHRRLLSEAEAALPDPPEYPIENFNVPTQKQNRATVAVRQGVAAGVPAAQAAGPNEVPLYHVRVEANAVAVTADKVTDVRNQMRSLRDAWAQLDALNASPAISGFNEAVDDRVAALLADGTYLTEVYNDAAGTLTYDVDLPALQVPLDLRYVQLANLSELVDDRHQANTAVTANTGLSRAYDDVNNLFTWAGVAATGAAMGMMPAADKAKLDAATDANTASAIVRRDAAGDFAARDITQRAAFHSQVANSARPTLATFNNAGIGANTGVNLDFYTGHGGGGSSLYNRITQETGVQGGGTGTSGAFRFYCAEQPGLALTEVLRLDVHSPQASVFGNFSATGSVSGGSKPFLIDHPLPELSLTKFLRYVAVESPRADVYVRGRAQLEAGRVVIDLDEEARQSAGTLLALARDLQAYAWNESAGPARWERVAWEVVGRTLIIESQNPDVSLAVGFIVFGERHDPFIRHSEMTDDEGRWVTEFDKPTVDGARLAQVMAAREEVVEADEDAKDTTRTEVVTELAGTRGFLLHPEAKGAEPPHRDVTRKTRRRSRQGREGGGKNK